jgi:hypothetical protein
MNRWLARRETDHFLRFDGLRPIAEHMSGA